MSFKTNVVEVTVDNISQHPQAICFINPKHEFYAKKIEWLKEQFENGLRIKLLYLEGEKRPIGFIEYVPGEYCWRSVDAKGYMFRTYLKIDFTVKVRKIRHNAASVKPYFMRLLEYLARMPLTN